MGRGRPRGSKHTKEREPSKTQTSLTTCLTAQRRDESESESDSGDESETFSKELKKIKRRINDQLEKLEEEFNKSIVDIKQSISDISEENQDLKNRLKALEEKVEKLETGNKTHDLLINKNERFSRRSNIRIVGVPTTQDENCLEIVNKILSEVGLDSPKIERAHRDGKLVRGRDRHILVKLSFYPDKITTMKKARQALAPKPYYIIDDLTHSDLMEKRKWSSKVQELYQSGTKLRFSAGCWRTGDGKPYKFDHS